MTAPLLRVTDRMRRRWRAWSDGRDIAKVCEEYNLELPFALDADAASVFKEVFIGKAYADAFPFHTDARIVDIGAHFGFFTLFALRSCGLGARLCAVEPAAANQARLSEILRANGGSSAVRVLPCAVGREDGEGSLALAAPQNRVLRAGSVPAGFAAEKVRVLSLTTLLEEAAFDAIDFMKIDCEGAEYDFLLNARPEDLRRIQALSLEFHDGGVPEKTGLHLRRFLEKSGFRILHCRHEPTWRNLSTGKLVAVRE